MAGTRKLGKKKRAGEPHVGIFWLVDGKLIFDRTPLNAAEAHLHFKIHGGDHISVWDKLQKQRLAPIDMEYEEPPRGRVMYDTKAEAFAILADKCILKNKATARDSHYRCHVCLYGKDDEESEA